MSNSFNFNATNVKSTVNVNEGRNFNYYLWIEDENNNYACIWLSKEKLDSLSVKISQHLQDLYYREHPEELPLEEQEQMFTLGN